MGVGKKLNHEVIKQIGRARLVASSVLSHDAGSRGMWAVSLLWDNLLETLKDLRLRC